MNFGYLTGKAFIGSNKITSWMASFSCVKGETLLTLESLDAKTQ